MSHIDPVADDLVPAILHLTDSEASARRLLHAHRIIRRDLLRPKRERARLITGQEWNDQHGGRLRHPDGIWVICALMRPGVDSSDDGI